MLSNQYTSHNKKQPNKQKTKLWLTIKALTKIRYACCNLSGPFQCMQIIPTTPKFQIINDNVK